jgi:hypothetical protein
MNIAQFGDVIDVEELNASEHDEEYEVKVQLPDGSIRVIDGVVRDVETRTILIVVASGYDDETYDLLK